MGFASLYPSYKIRLPRRRHRLVRKAREEGLQGGQRRMIGDAVDAGGAEMALEGDDHFHGGGVVFAVEWDGVAVSRQRLLQVADVVADGAELERLAAHDRRRLYPVADPGIGQRVPGKFLAGVLLARRGDVGMPEHPMRRNLAAEPDAAAQRAHGGRLAPPELRIAPI